MYKAQLRSVAAARQTFVILSALHAVCSLMSEPREGATLAAMRHVSQSPATNGQ